MAQIILQNKANIDFEKEYFEDILTYAKLPDGEICLILSDNSLPENNQGVCVSSQLIRFAFLYNDLCSCGLSWDCCVAISNKWCDLRNEFPAYFTYLIGHEFGHATVCLSDITLHIHCCIVHDFIKPASNGIIEFSHELPHEQLFDQFGKYLAAQLYGAEKLHNEIEEINSDDSLAERNHLDLIKNLSESHNYSDLRKNLIDFSIPYRDELIKYWKRDVAQNGKNSLASYISDFGELFKY